MKNPNGSILLDDKVLDLPQLGQVEFIGVLGYPDNSAVGLLLALLPRRCFESLNRKHDE